LHRTRFIIVGVFLLVVLLGACSHPTVPSGPKFSGRLLVLADSNTPDINRQGVEADLIEITAGPNSTFNRSTITTGVFEAVASPDQAHLLYATKDGIALRDLRSGEVKELAKGENYCLAWAPDGKRFSYKQRSGPAKTTYFVSDLNGKATVVWDDLSADNRTVNQDSHPVSDTTGCPQWVAPNKLIFDRMGPSQKRGADVKPNTTTLAVLDDSVRLTDSEKKWSVEGICEKGSAFLRSHEGEILIAKSLENLKTANPTPGPCSSCRFVGFAAKSCVPYFIEDSSSTSSELFYLNPANWQRQRSTHIGQPFSVTARMLINSAARLMVAGDVPASLWVIDAETGDITPFFPKPGEPMMSDGSLRNPRPVVWIEK
jgi:hypothetical protein